jgi:hypothetical protein
MSLLVGGFVTEQVPIEKHAKNYYKVGKQKIQYFPKCFCRYNDDICHSNIKIYSLEC